jgi:hypothetical protein
MTNLNVIEYNVTDAAIAEMKSQYMGLVVKDLNDDKGLAEVHRARMIVKGKRVDVEKRRKELKADALMWGKKVDSEANRIFGLLEPIETHLENEENKVTKEKARIKAEEEKKKHETTQARVDALMRFGVACPYANALAMTQGEFDARIIIAEDEYKQEQARKAEEARIEAERIEAEKMARAVELASIAKEQKRIDDEFAEIARVRRLEEDKRRSERDKIEAERREVENARRKIEHDAAVEKAKKEAAEKATREAKEQAEREACEKAEAEQQARAEDERQEALKPDKDKLIFYANKLTSFVAPLVGSKDAELIVREAEKRLLAINRYIIKAAQEL